MKKIKPGYIKSDITRWQAMDFVLGYEICLSSNTSKDCGVCKILVGKYPKSFIWGGWHDGCKCHAVPIIEDYSSKERSEDRSNALRAALYGTEYEPPKPINSIKYLPENFIKWFNENSDLLISRSLDWVKINKELIDQSCQYYQIK